MLKNKLKPRNEVLRPWNPLAGPPLPISKDTTLISSLPSLIFSPSAIRLHPNILPKLNLLGGNNPFPSPSPKLALGALYLHCVREAPSSSIVLSSLHFRNIIILLGFILSKHYLTACHVSRALVMILHTSWLKCDSLPAPVVRLHFHRGKDPWRSRLRAPCWFSKRARASPD